MEEKKTFLSRMFDSNDAGVEAHILLTAVAVVVLLFAMLWEIIAQQKTISLMDCGTGIGGILCGGGAASWGIGIQRREQGDDK